MLKYLIKKSEECEDVLSRPRHLMHVLAEVGFALFHSETGKHNLNEI
jgi:hypothetical protein